MEYKFMKKIAYLILVITFINIFMCIFDYCVVKCNEWMITIFALQIANIIFLFISYKTPNMIKKRLLIILAIFGISVTPFIPVMDLNIPMIRIDSDPVYIYKYTDILVEKHNNIYFITLKEIEK